MRFDSLGLAAAFALAWAVGATAGERELLWPAGKKPLSEPEQIAAMIDVVEAAGFSPDAHREPFLEWFDEPAPDRKTDTCAILVSGGAYEMTCDVPLVREWRERLTALGVTCVNLVYRTPRPKGAAFYATAWADGQRAVRLVRSEAEKRGFNPERIGVFGMSAGGHLAMLLAASSGTAAYPKVDALDDLPCHVNFACAFAPAYALSDGYGTLSARDGDAVDVTLDPVFKFDAKTCQTCLCHGGADSNSPFVSTRLYRRLRQAGVPAELHLYADRPHGAFGLDRAVEFLRALSFLGKPATAENIFTRFESDADRAEYMYEKLWPEGKAPNSQTNFCTAALEWHIPRELKTKAIQVIWSGGAYMGNSPSSFEVTPARRYLNAKGMTVVTVQYRSPRPSPPLAKHTAAWQDIQRAIRIVRKGAARRGLDPNRIGVMGASAGGHLALMGVTSSRHRSYLPIDEIDEIPCSVQWGVAVYPAYVLTDGVDDCNAHRGNEDGDRIVDDFSFDLSTTPVCFIHGDADGYSAMGSVKVWERLRRMGVQGDLHTLVGRNHCFMVDAAPGTGSYTWLDRIWEFLSDKGFNR